MGNVLPFRARPDPRAPADDNLFMLTDDSLAAGPEPYFRGTVFEINYEAPPRWGELHAFTTIFGGLHVRKIYRLPGGFLKLAAEHPAYPPAVMPEQTIGILGPVERAYLPDVTGVLVELTVRPLLVARAGAAHRLSGR